MKILVVDDDPRLREIVSVALTRAGFGVVTAADGRMALTHAGRERPDLIVLDVGLPEMDGFEVCRKVRAQGDVPILFLTAHDDEIDRILGLELGADDYVTKPFSPRELVARIRAILKRSTPGPGRKTLRHGDLCLDPAAHLCRVGQAEVSLTMTEFSILERLLRQRDAVQGKRQIVDSIWGIGSQVSERTFDSHLRNIRRKLAAAGRPEAIETLHGVGIRLRRVEP
ncbi:MAG: response regulator transcription factor [Pseudomonadota bacterium]